MKTILLPPFAAKKVLSWSSPDHLKNQGLVASPDLRLMANNHPVVNRTDYFTAMESLKNDLKQLEGSLDKLKDDLPSDHPCEQEGGFEVNVYHALRGRVCADVFDEKSHTRHSKVQIDFNPDASTFRDLVDFQIGTYTFGAAGWLQRHRIRRGQIGEPDVLKRSMSLYFSEREFAHCFTGDPAVMELSFDHGRSFKRGVDSCLEKSAAILVMQMPGRFRDSNGTEGFSVSVDHATSNRFEYDRQNGRWSRRTINEPSDQRYLVKSFGHGEAFFSLNPVGGARYLLTRFGGESHDPLLEDPGVELIYGISSDLSSNLEDFTLGPFLDRLAHSVIDDWRLAGSNPPLVRYESSKDRFYAGRTR